uniref:uncharacterized protein LOC120335188 n=1 Tax=Styela clava TaxID=7725 RepID=UPI0019392768|nr:uncharacterized protein LOC120335188 [Styela clava]
MEDAAWKIFSGVKDASTLERRSYRERMKIIATSSESRSQKYAVSELKSHISKTSSVGSRISTMIFAYKGGTQIVEEVFTFQSLSVTLLDEGEQERHISKRIQQIRESTVIVAIEGKNNLPDDLAKISVNLSERSEVEGSVEEQTIIGPTGKSAHEVNFNFNQKKNLKRSLLNSLASSSAASLNIVEFLIDTGALKFILSILGITLSI